MSLIGNNSKNFVDANSLTPQQKQTLRKVIQELNDSMTRIAAEREFIKEAVKDVSEKMHLDNKVVRRMAKTYFKSTFNEESEENKMFEDFYTLVLNSGTTDAK